MFLEDVFIVENLQVLEEGKSSKAMKIRGVFQRADEANNNGRIYPKMVLESQIKKLAPLIEGRRLCGELDHPQSETVKLSNASHLITKLEMRGNEVIGEAEILSTPAGMTAKALIEGGVKIGISSRGMGTLSEDTSGAKIVNEDYRMVTLDLVADPSTRGAFPELCESTQGQFVAESMSKLSKEANFLTLLEDRLTEKVTAGMEGGSKKSLGKGTGLIKKGVEAAGQAVKVGAAGAGKLASFRKAGTKTVDQDGETRVDQDGRTRVGGRQVAVDQDGRTRGEAAKAAMGRVARSFGGNSVANKVLQRDVADRYRDQRRKARAEAEAEKKGNEAEAAALAAKKKANQDKKSQHFGRKAAEKRAARKAARTAELERNRSKNQARPSLRDRISGKGGTEDQFKAHLKANPPEPKKQGPPASAKEKKKLNKAKQKAHNQMGKEIGKVLRKAKDLGGPGTASLGDPTKIEWPPKK